MLIQYGDKWMKETWLPEITPGEMPFATAVSEPACGSNTAGMETRAKRNGGEYFVSVLFSPLSLYCWS